MNEKLAIVAANTSYFDDSLPREKNSPAKNEKIRHV